YQVSQYYSNIEARTHITSPCVPANGNPYLGVASDPNIVSVSAGGDTGTVTLDAFSYGATNVALEYEIVSLYGSASQLGLDVFPQSGTLMPGGTTTLHISAGDSAAAFQYPFLIYAGTKGGAMNIWPLVVTVD